jgi:hypothetical protein
MIKFFLGATGIGLGTTIKYLRRTTSAAAGNYRGTMINFLCGAASIGLGFMSKYLQRTTSAAARNGLGTTIKYLRCTTSRVAGLGWAQ